MEQSLHPEDTTGNLIAAGKVSGTSVYDTAGEKLGSIYDVMIDKSSGTARYAVMNFGGLFGIGGHYYPLPWNTLRYDSERGGYVVNIDRSKLEGAPSYDKSDSTLWGDDRWDGRVNDYYGSRTESDIGFGATTVPGLGNRTPLI